MSFLELVQTFGLPIGMALFGIVALYFDLVVSGRRYRRVLRERDQFLRLALSGTRVGERSARVAERVVNVLASHQESEADDGDGLDS